MSVCLGFACFFAASETMWPLWGNQPQRRSSNWLSAPTQQTSHLIVPLQGLGVILLAAALFFATGWEIFSFDYFQKSSMQLNIGKSWRVAAKHKGRTPCFLTLCQQTHGSVWLAGASWVRRSIVKQCDASPAFIVLLFVAINWNVGWVDVQLACSTFLCNAMSHEVFGTH